MSCQRRRRWAARVVEMKNGRERIVRDRCRERRNRGVLEEWDGLIWARENNGQHDLSFGRLEVYS
jgi:hypothetical protein